MSKTHDVPGGRMEVNGVGAGESSDAAIKRRANELARTEGREHASESDRVRARDELNGPVHPPVPPEAVEPRIEGLVSWDEPVESSGRRTERMPGNDEGTIAEQLVQEGVEEADHQRRVSAVDEQDKEAGPD